MAWQSYELDRTAQKLVLAARQHDPDSLNQAFKMRGAVAYGLERFWGEQVRLQEREPSKARYWRATWEALVQILQPTGVKLPNDKVQAQDVKAIETMAQKLWAIEVVDQRVALAVLTQLCDCLVWWTQRYK